MTDLARQNMVEQQIRTWDVLDADVLGLYADNTLKREDFVDDADKKRLAYADIALPINDGQQMLEPKLEARILQTLAPAANEKILHVGTGSGFFAALLGRLLGSAGSSGSVVSVEINPALAKTAAARLATAATNVRVVTGDGARGWPDDAPYNAIVFTGAVPVLADELLTQLTDDGRIVAVVGQSPAMALRLLHVKKGTVVLQRDLLETCLPLLDNAPSAAAFTF